MANYGLQLLTLPADREFSERVIHDARILHKPSNTQLRILVGGFSTLLAQGLARSDLEYLSVSYTGPGVVAVPQQEHVATIDLRAVPLPVQDCEVTINWSERFEPGKADARHQKLQEVVGVLQRDYERPIALSLNPGFPIKVYTIEFPSEIARQHPALAPGALMDRWE